VAGSAPEVSAGCGSGKTSIALELAHGFDLQVYFVPTEEFQERALTKRGGTSRSSQVRDVRHAKEVQS
jgi:hypothetical protein